MRITKRAIVVRDMSMYVVENLSHLLRENPRWESYWRGRQDVDIMWDLMVNIFTETLDMLCPWKRIRIRDDQPEWFDGDLYRAVKEKGILYKIAESTQNILDWESYKSSRKNVRTQVTKKKRNFIITKLNENRNVPKKFWKEIQSNLHFGNEKTIGKLITIKNIDGDIKIGKNAAEPLNMHYASVGQSLAEKFSIGWSPTPSL